MGLFDRVGLRTNGRVQDKAYTRKMMGEGRSFEESQPEQVLCPECGEDLEKESLMAHRQNLYDVVKGVQVSRATRK